MELGIRTLEADVRRRKSRIVASMRKRRWTLRTVSEDRREVGKSDVAGGFNRKANAKRQNRYHKRRRAGDL